MSTRRVRLRRSLFSSFNPQKGGEDEHSKENQKAKEKKKSEEDVKKETNKRSIAKLNKLEKGVLQHTAVSMMEVIPLLGHCNNHASSSPGH